MKTLLSQRLRAARQALHPLVTQRDVAKRLKRSASAINLWEAGKTQPSAEDLAELSRWFQVSADWLLGVDTTALTTRKTSAAPPLPADHRGRNAGGIRRAGLHLPDRVLRRHIAGRKRAPGAGGTRRGVTLWRACAAQIRPGRPG